MPWQSDGGKGGGPWGGGGGPWGGGGRGGSPWGGRGGPGPDLEDLLRQGQDRLKRLLPGGGPRGMILLGLIVIAVWLASGFYRVGTDQQGVVLRFGEWVRTTQPGLNYYIPAPIESVLRPQVTRINRADIGFRSASEAGTIGRVTPLRDVTEESLMLTGDENIVDIDFSVFWRIRKAGEFLFNVRNPEGTVKSAAEAAMREIIGQTPIQPILTEGRARVEQATRDRTQQLVDQYGAGVEIIQVQLQKADPPAAVIDAFKDVQRAEADRERARNEAESYRNDIIPRARGEAERLIQEAQAFKEQTVANADGDAKRFLSQLSAYSQAKEVTRQRIYLETLEQVLGSTRKVVVDTKGGGAQAVIPYLPLPELRPQEPAGQQAPAPQPQQQGGRR
ncbi:MAG: FtsH protease activity modulator HflK [Proteobacteria bacterium]|nr:FtsH protease activity modulator HflK [Pseudomonadota bacterium]